MAQLVVRNIEQSVKVKLQRRAKRNGRSMEEEVREILRDATKNEGTSARAWERRSRNCFAGLD